MFEHITKNIETINEMQALGAEQIEKLKASYCGLPDDYISFLEKVGFGNVSEFQLYDSPVRPSSVYDDIEGLEQIILIGDDFQGYCFGFDLSDDFRLVEVSPIGEVDKTIEESFIKLLESYFC